MRVFTSHMGLVDSAVIAPAIKLMKLINQNIKPVDADAIWTNDVSLPPFNAEYVCFP